MSKLNMAEKCLVVMSALAVIAEIAKDYDLAKETGGNVIVALTALGAIAGALTDTLYLHPANDAVMVSPNNQPKNVDENRVAAMMILAPIIKLAIGYYCVTSEQGAAVVTLAGIIAMAARLAYTYTTQQLQPPVETVAATIASQSDPIKEVNDGYGPMAIVPYAGPKLKHE